MIGRHALFLILLPDLHLRDITLDGNGRLLAVFLFDRDLLAVDLGDLARDRLIFGGDGGDRLARIDPDTGFCPPAKDVHSLERPQAESENDQTKDQRQPIFADPAPPSPVLLCVLSCAIQPPFLPLVLKIIDVPTHTRADLLPLKRMFFALRQHDPSAQLR